MRRAVLGRRRRVPRVPPRPRRGRATLRVGSSLGIARSSGDRRRRRDRSFTALTAALFPHLADALPDRSLTSAAGCRTPSATEGAPSGVDPHRGLRCHILLAPAPAGKKRLKEAGDGLWGWSAILVRTNRR